MSAELWQAPHPLPLLVFFQTELILPALPGFYPSLCLGASEAAMEQTFILGT